MIETARAAFLPLAVRPELKEAALQHLQRWLTDPQLADWRPQIDAMFEKKRWDLLLDCFYQVLPFGTGGRRGPVGVGPNRFNPWTLSASVQGHVEWLKSKYGSDQPLSVVIAYDVRRYLDSVNLYDRSLPNPAMGLSSRDFAEIAAGVYVANGVSVTMLPPGSETYVSAPELSFAIRHLGASGGLNISASHNPPDDNGGKFYNALGGQEVPPDDERMATLVEQVQEVRSVSYAEGRRLGRIQDYGSDIHDAYVAANLSTSLKPQARSASVVFTGLHGTGDTTVAEVLRAAGFHLSIEPTQASHDGSFPNVPFRTPNPEVRASMERAVAMAKEQGADLVMACDPDADRIGLCCRDGEDFRFFTGNEIGVLVTEYRLLYGNNPRPIVLKTEVTSDLIRRVAERHGARVVGNLMVGFKYIGEALRLLESEGSFLGIEGSLEDFCVGIEESHGVLVTPLIRDKDAAGAALALAEYASLLKEEGKTLADALRGLWLREGYLHNDLVSTVMRGAAGRARIEKIQQGMRDNPPTEIGGHAVTAFHDRADPKGPWGPIKSGTDAASRDMLVFQLGPDRRILLRPSGTEPKNKIYVEVCGRPGAPLETEVPLVVAEAKDLAIAFAQQMLARVDIHLPAWALRVSDLVAIEHKQHFAEVVIPGLCSRLSAGEPVQDWLADQLRPYGKDPLRLVADAVRAWAVQGSDDAGAVRAVFGV